MMEADRPRYSFPPLFLAALFFVAAAPLFWLLTELHHASLKSSYANASLYQYYYPMYQHAYDRLAQGDVPLWNARQLCGVPLQADPRVGLFQPLNAVFLLLPAERAMAVHAYLCLAAMGTFFVLWLRSLGLGYTPALLGGIIYAFSGASAGSISYPPLAAALAWMPFAAWGLSVYLRTFRIEAAILAGIGLALVILAGAYAVLLVFTLFWIPFALAGVAAPQVRVPVPLPRRALGLVLIPFVALLITTVQWIPTLVWIWKYEGALALAWGPSPAAYTASSWGGLVAQFFDDEPGTLPLLSYVGVASLPLLPAALFHRDAKRYAWYFALAVPLLFAALIAAYGRSLLAFPREALGMVAVMPLAALAALGLDRILTPRDIPHAPGIFAPCALSLAAAAALFVFLRGSPRGWLLVLVLAFVPFLLVRWRGVAVLSGLAVAAAIFTDLNIASNNSYTHPFVDIRERMERLEPALELARRQALGSRVVTSSEPLTPPYLSANIGMLSEVRAAGADGLAPSREQAKWWQAMTGSRVTSVGSEALSPEIAKPELLNFMAVQALILSADSPLSGGMWERPHSRFREMPGASDLRLFVNEDALPRAYWVPRWRVVHGVPHAIDTLGEADFDPARECLIDRQTPGVAAVPGPPSADPQDTTSRLDAQCRIQELSPEQVVVGVTAPKSGMLILADSYDSGWQARVDGTPQPLFRANGIFRGVLVGAGEHEVVFHYRPMPLVIGAAVSLVGLALLAIFGFTTLLRVF